MKVYTKTGDKGKTALFGGTRVSKSTLRIDAYGTVDELNSWIGLLRDQPIENASKEVLMQIQDHLFTLGAVLATAPDKELLKNGKNRLNIPRVNDDSILFLEQEIDTMETNLTPMTHFILPGGNQSVSFCHITRTVCRRAERLATELFENEPFDDSILGYLNRLSDYLFVLARKLSKELNAEEIKWIPKKTQ